MKEFMAVTTITIITLIIGVAILSGTISGNRQQITENRILIQELAKNNAEIIGLFYDAGKEEK